MAQEAIHLSASRDDRLLERATWLKIAKWDSMLLLGQAAQLEALRPRHLSSSHSPVVTVDSRAVFCCFQKRFDEENVAGFGHKSPNYFLRKEEPDQILLISGVA